MMPESEGATQLDPDDLEGLLPEGVLTRADLDLWEQQGVLTGRRWAGAYRKTDENIGVHWQQVATSMCDVVDDARLWIESDTWPHRELAARFHHRLVAIHPFPNGNGRWSRLATDALMASMRPPLPTWGASMDKVTVRQAYLDALRAADRGDFGSLVEFLWG